MLKSYTCSVIKQARKGVSARSVIECRDVGSSEREARETGSRFMTRNLIGSLCQEQEVQ